MLYEWLEECGVSMEQAQDIFDFDAVYDKFPGYNVKGGHATPTYEQMLEYYNRSLREKITKYNKIIILGNVAKMFLLSTNSLLGKHILYLIHPSRLNFNLYQRNKETIISNLKQFIHEDIYHPHHLQ
jgi:uracil-DNA glycosylase